jgi:hypothetical protein
MSNRAEFEQEWQHYLSCPYANRPTRAGNTSPRLSALVAEQFMADSPHGGDLKALQASFASATQKTREAVAQYRAWLTKQQGGSP